MTLGQKLKEIRKRFGLSQESLAEIMNVSRQAITKWESDEGLPDGKRSITCTFKNHLCSAIML